MTTSTFAITGSLAVCLSLTTLLLAYNLVGVPFATTGRLADLGRAARRRGPVGDQTRGVVTDTVVNLVLVVFGALAIASEGYSAQEVATLIPILTLMSEAANFVLDTGFRTETMAVLFGGPNDRLSCPKAYETAKSMEKNMWRTAYLTVGNLGTDVGFRSFLIMVVNFMIATQFEAAGRKRMEEGGAKPSAMLPLLLWWMVTLLCSSLLNIVRFGWAYRATTTTPASKGKPGVASESILLFLLLVALTFMANADVSTPPNTRVVLSFALMLLGVVGMTMGVFDVPSCDEYREADVRRVVAQASLFALVLVLLMASGVSTLYARRVDVAITNKLIGVL